ncbi:hypothetical protein GYMLUDRAFT_250112 [Collybiopsis luxurians FD-317 M1]|uniref:Hydrophobin n=1 Tax=Collybiopsis luxurians FD-317 M1 TaxID=944289 RepID=A0A0D0CFQ4_9AGAR|nr:hypothetical protein GYMLUDRAFT_250112 [Collybiopsis luxurians FD-317 M1]
MKEKSFIIVIVQVSARPLLYAIGTAPIQTKRYKDPFDDLCKYSSLLTRTTSSCCSSSLSPLISTQLKLAFVSAALATVAVAIPAPGNEPASSCTTGPIQCCNSVVPASDASATKTLGLLGIVLQDLNVLVGLTCDPITVIAIGSASWYILSGGLYRLQPHSTAPVKPSAARTTATICLCFLFTFLYEILIIQQGTLISIGCVPGDL